MVKGNDQITILLLLNAVQGRSEREGGGGETLKYDQKKWLMISP
jgi:hypothetical protein